MLDDFTLVIEDTKGYESIQMKKENYLLKYQGSHTRDAFGIVKFIEEEKKLGYVKKEILTN